MEGDPFEERPRHELWVVKAPRVERGTTANGLLWSFVLGCLTVAAFSLLG
jgi:hypothetical protein